MGEIDAQAAGEGVGKGETLEINEGGCTSPVLYF